MSDQVKPTVSIGMAVFNASGTVREALNSVLWQTYPHWELIVIDDGSTDDTVEIIRTYRDVRICLIADGRNLGLAARLNQAIDLSQGGLFARMDADDVAYPERLHRQIEFLQEHPEIDLLGTNAVAFAGCGLPLGTFKVGQTHSELCRTPWHGIGIPHPTWMGKTSWFRKYRYDQRMRRAQDQELLVRAHENSQFACLPEVLLGYRYERTTLKKRLTSRYYLTQVQVMWCLKNARVLQMIRGVGATMAKAFLEVLACAFHMTEYLEQRRFADLTDRARQDWQKCWVAVSKGDRVSSCAE